MATRSNAHARNQLRTADALHRAGDFRGALDTYLAAASVDEHPDAAVCLRVARTAADTGDPALAVRWLRALVDAEPTFRTWQSAARLLERLPADAVAGETSRSARAVVVGSYTTTQLAAMLPLAALRASVHLEVHEGGYDQYQQDILDPASAVYGFGPDYVIVAVHDGALGLPAYAEDPEQAVADEVGRWQSLWAAVGERSSARVVQHLFALSSDTEFGHLSARLPGSRLALTRAVNAALGQAAGNDILVVDTERLAARVGKRRWRDERYWHLAKQAVSLDALPLLARDTTAVIAGDLGLAKKCLVLDLDNTLWGGVVGEDGLAGIRLGDGPEGEAYASFQEAVLALKRRGVVLAVASKNNEHDAFEVFDSHPEMRLRRNDIASFVANWEAKPDNIRLIAQELDLGLDALVYVDDNPAERELVRRTLPEVDVLTLPADPAGFASALYDYPYFETTYYTAEDATRADRYRVRAAATRVAAAATDLDSFLRDLDMIAEVAPFDELNLPRIVQLIGKTNQFNLTSRRHPEQHVRALMESDGAVTAYMKLRDRFGDHGLVGVAIGVRDDTSLEIDTLLMSCRVIGRTAERVLLGALQRGGVALGCTTLRGTYVPTPKNALVKDLYAENGFAFLANDGDGATVWEYTVAQGPIASAYIATTESA